MADFSLSVTVSAIDKISKPISGISKKLSSLSKPIKAVQRGFRRFARETRLNELRTRINNVGNSFRSFSGRVASAAKSTAVAFGAFVGSGALLGKTFIDTASKVESLKVRLISLTKSEEEANKKFRAFSSFAARAPFSLEEVIESGVTLEAFGLKSEETLDKLGDLASFMGLDMQESASALGRAFAGGAGAADILRERGVLNLVKDFAKLKFGVTDITKLTLPAFRKILLGAIADPAGKISGATDKMAKTFAGRMSMIGDSIFNVRKSIGDALIPAISDLAEKHITPLLKGLILWLGRNKALISQNVSAFFNKIGSAISFLVRNKLNLLEVLKGVSETFQGFGRIILNIVGFIAEKLNISIRNSSGEIKSITEVLGSFIDKLGGFRKIGNIISTLIGIKIAFAFSSMGMSIGLVIKDLFLLGGSLASSIKGMVLFFKTMSVTAAYNKLIAGISLAASSVWSFTAALFANPITWYIGLVIALAGAAFLIFKNWEPVSAFFIALWNDISTAFGNGFNVVTGFLGDILTSLGEWIVNLTGFDLFAIGADFINGFLDGMKSIWGSVTSWIGEAISSLTALIPDSIKNFLGFGTGAAGKVSVAEKTESITNQINNKALATSPLGGTGEKPKAQSLLTPTFKQNIPPRNNQNFKGNLVVEFRNAPPGTRIVQLNSQGNADLDIDAGLSFAVP